MTWPSIEVHRDYVAEQLEAGMTSATVHQRLRDECGLDASVAPLRRDCCWLVGLSRLAAP